MCMEGGIQVQTYSGWVCRAKHRKKKKYTCTPLTQEESLPVELQTKSPHLPQLPGTGSDTNQQTEITDLC